MSLCIDSPVITIAPIDDPRARDTVMLTLAVTVSSIVIQLLQLSLKVVGTAACSPSYLLLESSYWPFLILKGLLLLKHMYWEKALIPCSRILANHLNLP